MTSRSRRVDVEGVLVADRLRRVAVVDRVRRRSRGPGPPATRRACRTGGPRRSGGQGREVADRPHAVLAPATPRSSRRRPTAGAIGSGARKAASSPARHDDEAVGLAQVRGDLGHELGRRHPDRGGQPDLGADAVLDRAPRSPGRRRTGACEPVTSRNASSIEIGSTSGVNRRRIGHDVAAGLLVAPAVDRQEDAVRAAPDRLAQATSPSGRRTCAPRSWPPRRRPRPPGSPPTMTGRPRSSGSIALLDGREERVEVDVQDRPVGHARYHRPAVEAPTSTVPDRGPPRARRRGRRAASSSPGSCR